MNFKKTIRNAWPRFADFLGTTRQMFPAEQLNLIQDIEKPHGGQRAFDTVWSTLNGRVLASWLTWKVLSHPGSVGLVIHRDEPQEGEEENRDHERGLTVLANLATTFDTLPAVQRHLDISTRFKIGTDPGWMLYGIPLECYPVERNSAVTYAILTNPFDVPTAEDSLFRTHFPCLRRLIRTY